MTTLKRLIPCAVIPSLMAIATTAVLADEFDAMHKQLNIMSKIIKTSASVDGEYKTPKINGVESVYLKGQGVIFTISSSSRHNRWGNYNFNFVMPDLPPVAPIAPVAPKLPVEFQDVEVNFDSKDISKAMEKAAEQYERAMEAVHDDRERFQDLREEQRDLAYEVRDLEREKRDLEFQLRRADAESQKELESEMKQLEQQRNKIEQARVLLAEKSKEIRQEQQAQRQVQEKEREGYYQALTVSLAETFCLYGNGLKAVPRNENVSLIIKSGGAKEKNRYKDQIYVFSKKDISDCAIDKINVAKLIEKGKGYQF